MTLVLFHSPKGGVGNSFLAAHCAMELARRGHETVAIDFTYQGALKLFFSLLPDQELVQLDDPGNDEVVVAGVELFDGYRLSRSEDFRNFLTEDSFAEVFPERKIVVADIASDDRELRALLAPHAALHVCPIVPRPISLAALVKVDPDVALVDLQKTAIVLNMLDDTRTLSRHSHKFVRTAFEHLLAGAVRYDENVTIATANFDQLATAFPKSAVLADLRELTDVIEQRCGLLEAAVESSG